MEKFDPNYGLKNDDKGKLHELLVGHFLMHDTDHENPDCCLPTSLPRFPLKPSRKLKKKSKAKFSTPEELHELIRLSISSENYNNHIRIAKFTAKNIKKELETAKLISIDKNLNSGKISNIFWSSNPGDVEFILGKKDESNTSDLVLTIKKRFLVVEIDGGEEFVGLSLKLYNEFKPTNLANCGRGSIDKILNIDTSHFEQAAVEHAHRAAEKYEINTRNLTKKQAHDTIKINSNNSFTKEIRELYYYHAKEQLNNITEDYFKKIKSMNSSDIGEILVTIANVKPTIMKMYKSETYGTDKLTHSFENPFIQIASILHKHKKYINVTKEANSPNIKFRGKDKVSIANLNLKYQSSTPFTGVIGIFQGWNSSVKQTIDLKTKKEIQSKFGY